MLNNVHALQRQVWLSEMALTTQCEAPKPNCKYSTTRLYGTVRGRQNCTLYPENPGKRVNTVTMRSPARGNTTT